MTQNLNYLRETASQTAGPYVHIGLAPGAAGFELFEKELGQDIAGPMPRVSVSPSQDAYWTALGHLYVMFY